MSPYGLVVEKVYWIGELRLPDSVVASINAKIGATQKAQQRENEIQQARAEADIKIQEARGIAESTLMKAKAQADANQLLAKSITPELVQYQSIEKWDGRLPTYSGTGANFLFGVGK